MLNFRQFLEMPITNIGLVGNWDKQSKQKYRWRDADVAKVTRPGYFEQVKEKWANTEQDFNIWFCRSANCYKHVEVGPVDMDFVRDKLKLKIVPNPNPQAGDEISYNPDAINVIYTNNAGAEWIPMTPWIMAHRLGHTSARERFAYGFGNAVRNLAPYEYFSNEVERDMKELLNDVYAYQRRPYASYYNYGSEQPDDTDKILKALAQELGSMNSARTGKLRAFFEFAHELFAQYIIEGKITFRPLPRSLKYHGSKGTYGRGNYLYKQKDLYRDEEEWNEHLGYLAEKYGQECDRILSMSVGKIFVM